MSHVVLIIEGAPQPRVHLAAFRQWWFDVRHRNSCRLECWLVSEVSVLAAACLASGPRDPGLLTAFRSQG